MGARTNNQMLFIFGIIFLLLAVLSPMINGGFGGSSTTYNEDIYDDAISGSQDFDDTNVLDFLNTLFFWVQGIPWWLALFITMIRVYFYVMLYDKFRGIS